jgi:phosphoenolpyruvate synthase/pyruvate phosphate dikinase
VTKIFSPFLLFPILIDDFFNDFSKKLKKYNFAQELIAAASQASIVFDYQKLRLALLKVKTKKDYQKLLPQFDYLTEYSLKERLYTEEDFREILKDIKEKKEEKEVKSYPIIAKRNEKSFQNILRLVKDKEIKAQLSFFHHYVNIRTERAEHLCKVLRYSRYFILALQKLLLQKKYQVTYEQAINLTKEEIYEFLRKGVLSVGMEELNQRVNDKYVVFFDCKKNKTSLIYDTSDISSIINKYKSVSGVEGFKGVIVSKGKVRGKVRIIYRGKDFSFFKQGEILVADSTSPSFMPVMKMSKAIVTNEGGITSHAAIVSRELGIPCVTGTKIATSVLQDGDEVEVDADKGEVIILKKI